MTQREYPELPLVGVGGVVILKERALLVRRGTEPLRGEWSIPGGLLEAGETLAEGVARELQEETGLTVRVLDLIEVVDRIWPDAPGNGTSKADLEEIGTPAKYPSRPSRRRPRYHYVILDYWCEWIEGEPRASEEILELAFAREEELPQYNLTPATLRIVGKAFAMTRARNASSS